MPSAETVEAGKKRKAPALPCRHRPFPRGSGRHGRIVGLAPIGANVPVRNVRPVAGSAKGRGWGFPSSWLGTLVPSGGSGSDKSAEKRFCRWVREGRYGGNLHTFGVGLNAGLARIMGSNHCRHGNAWCCPIWTPSRAKPACQSGYRPSWRKPALGSPISGSARIAPPGSGHPMSPQMWGGTSPGPVCSRCSSVAAGARAAMGLRQGLMSPQI